MMTVYSLGTNKFILSKFWTKIKAKSNQLFTYLEIEVTEVLIKYGADIDFMDSYNRTPLIRAMSRGRTI